MRERVVPDRALPALTPAAAAWCWAAALSLVACASPADAPPVDDPGMSGPSHEPTNTAETVHEDPRAQPPEPGPTLEAPAAPTKLVAFGGGKSVALRWTSRARDVVEHR